VGGLETQACLACGGLWLDRTVFEQLGASRERQGAVLGALPAPAIPPVVMPGQVNYRPCPACGQRMNRVNYARQSGVVLDICRAHGLWFDRDELRRVLAFIAGGGLDRARERELEDLKEARRAAAQARPQEASGLDLEAQAAVRPGWLTAAGLVGLAMDVAGHFLDRD
jgi:Zn-finger nucleic acid-binding protein